VHRPSEEPFAGPGLAIDQERREPAGVTLTVKQPPGLLPDGLDPRAVADQLG
jgi:hypothetical protein